MIGSLGYLAAIIWAVSPQLALMLAIPLSFSAVLMLVYAAWLVRRPSKTTTQAERVGRAFNGMSILLFVALVGGFSLVSEFLIRWLGAPGAFVGAAILGLADAHATSVSMATLAAGDRLTVFAAAIGVVLTLTTNMGVKIPTAFVAGSQSYGRLVMIGVGLLLVGLWSGGLLVLLTHQPALG